MYYMFDLTLVTYLNMPYMFMLFKMVVRLELWFNQMADNIPSLGPLKERFLLALRGSGATVRRPWAAP